MNEPTEEQMDAMIMENMRFIKHTILHGMKQVRVYGREVSVERIQKLQGRMNGNCVNCDLMEYQHIDGKCPFGPTQYRRLAPIIERGQITRVN